MAIESGYHKRHLHVDLGEPRFEERPLSDQFLQQYIGGRGFGAKFVWDNLVAHDFKVDPLGPENLLVIAPGPLTGGYLPSSGKCSFVSISPATGVYGDSSMGGGLPTLPSGNLLPRLPRAHSQMLWGLLRETTKKNGLSGFWSRKLVTAGSIFGSAPLYLMFSTNSKPEASTALTGI